jgi:hypothetical protein
MSDVMKRSKMKSSLVRHIGFFAVCLSIPFHASSASNCTVLSGTALTIPCIGVEGNYLSLGMEMFQTSPIRFRLASSAVVSSFPSCASFNSQTRIVHTPCFTFNGADYSVDLKLTNLTPIEVELSAFAPVNGVTTYLVTGSDQKLSASQQQTIASNMKTLDATVKQALVAVNEVLYTDAAVTSFADFDKRRKTAIAALTMLETQAKTVQTGTTRNVIAAPIARALPRATSAELAGGSLSLGISARADDIQSKLNNAAQITVTEAQRLRFQLQQEVNSVQAESYANAGGVYNTLHNAAFVIGTGAKIAGMVGSWFVAGPAMASGSIASQMVATAGFYLSNTSTAIGIANDVAIFTGNHTVANSIENSGLSIFGRANTVLGLITLRGDAVVDTANNAINVVDGLLGEYGYANINLTGSGSAGATSSNCSNPAPRSTTFRSTTFCPTQPPEVSPQLRTGTYRDPNTGSTVVSTGLDSDWASAIRNMPGQVLFDPVTVSAYEFNRADLVFTGHRVRYRYTFDNSVKLESASCSMGQLIGSMSGSTFNGSNNGSGGIVQTGSATINDSTQTLSFTMNSARGSATSCSYSVANFPMAYIGPTRAWGDVTGQAACDMVANFAYKGDYSKYSYFVFDGLECSNAMLSVILSKE